MDDHTSYIYIYFMRKKIMLIAALLSLASRAAAQHIWTLEECINHAIEHNISLQKTRANMETSAINISEQRGALLPSVSASVQQGLIWRPLSESVSNIVNGSISSASANKANYSGSYGVNAQWTVWNGGKRLMNIEQAQYSHDMAQLSLDESANSISEQIASRFVQILYMQEALKVNEQLLEHDRALYERGKDMVGQGQMSRSELAQLEAQVASGEYDVVQTRTTIAENMLSLKQLLELPPADELSVKSVSIDDDAALQLIPQKEAVYEYALEHRPEIKSCQTAIDQSRVSTRLAKAQRMPSVSLGAGFTDSHMSGNNDMGKQLKNNLSGNLSLGIAIPLFDQRQTRSSVAKAKVNETIAQLDLADAQKTLYQTIETYWLNANNSQQKFLASRTNVRSLNTTYELLEDQFKLGMTDITNLLQGRSNLLTAQQSCLQDKYTAVLNMLLLRFYQGEKFTL